MFKLRVEIEKCVQLKPLFSFAELAPCELNKITWWYFRNLDPTKFQSSSRPNSIIFSLIVVKVSIFLKILSETDIASKAILWKDGWDGNLRSANKTTRHSSQVMILWSIRILIRLVLTDPRLCLIWVYYDKANGSLLFLLEFNLKVFRENNTTIRVLLTFSGDRQFTVETTIFSDSGRLLRTGWNMQVYWDNKNFTEYEIFNCRWHCFKWRATWRGFDTAAFYNIQKTKNILNKL